MKKKLTVLLSLVLAFTLVLALVPAAAFAAAPIRLEINVAEGQIAYIAGTLDHGTLPAGVAVEYDATKGYTVTLSGANLVKNDADKHLFDYAGTSLTVVVEGANTIAQYNNVSDADFCFFHGIENDADPNALKIVNKGAGAVLNAKIYEDEGVTEGDDGRLTGNVDPLEVNGVTINTNADMLFTGAETKPVCNASFIDSTINCTGRGYISTDGDVLIQSSTYATVGSLIAGKLYAVGSEIAIKGAEDICIGVRKLADINGCKLDLLLADGVAAIWCYDEDPTVPADAYNININDTEINILGGVGIYMMGYLDKANSVNITGKTTGTISYAIAGIMSSKDVNFNLTSGGCVDFVPMDGATPTFAVGCMSVATITLAKGNSITLPENGKVLVTNHEGMPMEFIANPDNTPAFTVRVENANPKTGDMNMTIVFGSLITLMLAAGVTMFVAKKHAA